MEFILNSPVQRTLLFDSSSALVVAREKKAAQGNRLDADRCRFYLASRSKPRGYARQSCFTDEAPRCATAYSR
jgi:ATP phosphoribosyltransferase